MKRTLIYFAFTLMLAPLTFAASPCTLDRAVLAPYENAEASEEQWALSRRTVANFMSCAPETVDATSRRVFFDVVDREYRADHGQQLEQWQARRPGSQALFEGINVYQQELRDYMQRLVTFHGGDEFRQTIITFGNARTIASLGRPVKNDVLKMLGTPNLRYGLSGRHNPQREALAAVGFWIDPAERGFSATEKDEMTMMLTGLLTVSENVAPGDHRRLVETAIDALGRSDDPQAEKDIRKWMEKQDPKGSLYRKAAKAADAIHGRKK
jgi:hypothetical protein